MTAQPDASLDGQVENEERRLWAAFKVQDSLAARSALFDRHAEFARNIARRHYRERSRGDIEFADLKQLACAGLLEALDRFDPERGVPFRAFASSRISGSIADGIAKMSEVREQLSWKHRMRRERLRSLELSDTDAMTTEDALAALAELALGLALGFMLEGTGLYVEGTDDFGRSPSLRPTAYDSLAWNDVVTSLTTELSALPDREQLILRHHYMGGMGFEHLSSLLGISKARVSQLHRTALGLLRKRMTGRGHFRLER